MSTTYNALANAIAKEENSQWPNNPGAITDSNGNKIDFGSLSAGMTALQNKLSYDASGQSKVYSPTMSLSDFENVYTGGDANAANNVASMLGVSTSTTLSQLSDQSLYTLDPNTINLGPGNSVSLGNGTATTTTPDGTVSGSGSLNLLSNFETWLSSSSANIVSVVVGFILIAGAVFSFSSVKDTVVSTAKTAAKLAA